MLTTAYLRITINTHVATYVAMYICKYLRLTQLMNVYVTRPAKINHVGTFKYLRNTNLKYSILHNSPVPDSSHVRFILEVQQGNSY